LEAQGVNEDFLQHWVWNATNRWFGIDRLVMLLTDCASIRDAIAFPLLKQENGSLASLLIRRFCNLNHAAF